MTPWYYNCCSTFIVRNTPSFSPFSEEKKEKKSAHPYNSTNKKCMALLIDRRNFCWQIKKKVWIKPIDFHERPLAFIDDWWHPNTTSTPGDSLFWYEYDQFYRFFSACHAFNLDSIQVPKPDYSVTFFGFFHMCDLGVYFTFHFLKNITESSVIFLWNGVLILNWKENKEAGAICFEIRIPRKKNKELLQKVPSKIYGSSLIMERNKNIFRISLPSP